MILGVGTDIVRVERIKRLLERYPNFIEKVFTASEITYCQAKASLEQSYAARFAAKEAVMKALGTGWDGKINWLDIEVAPDAQGRPEILAHKGTQAMFENIGVQRIHLSLAHEKEFAVAFVVLEG